MKKEFLSLAALLLMAATPLMTSCSDSLDEVAPAEETKSNIVTITIAPPVAEAETRVTVSDAFKITGWEVDDEVTLYKVKNEDEYGAHASTLTGDGVTFRCIDAAAGTFIANLGTGNINDYTFAVYGAEAVQFGSSSTSMIALIPKTMCSEYLKDVVIMAAYKSVGGSYTMEVVNNVLRFSETVINADVEVAWASKGYNNTADRNFRLPFSSWGSDGGDDLSFYGICVLEIPDTYTGWTNAKPFTLKAGKVSYVNMGILGHGSDSWGLAKQDGTEVLPVVQVGNGTTGNGKAYTKGKLYNVKNPTATMGILTGTGYDLLDW